jgi:hypothetical protein
MAQADLETKITTAVLQEAANRADSVFNIAQGLGKRVDAAVSGLVHGVSVVAIADDAPAAAPDGAVYIVAATPKAGGVFVGHANEVASKAAGAWTFQAAHANETHLVETDNQMWTWAAAVGTTPAQWVKVGSVGSAEKVNEAIHKALVKDPPNDNDEMTLTDSEDTVNLFSLRKITWGKLKKAILDGWGPYFKGLSDSGRETTSPDLQGFLPTLDHHGEPWAVTWATLRNFALRGFGPHVHDNVAADALGDGDFIPAVGGGANKTFFKITWANVKDALKSWFGAAPVNTPADTDKLVTIGGVSGNLLHTTLASLKPYVLGALGVRIAASTNCATADVGDTDIMPLWNAAGTNENKVTVGTLKAALGSVYRKKLEVDNGGEDSMIFDISDYSGNPQMITIKGQTMATGTDNFRPSLWIKTTGAYINMATNYPTRAITTVFGDGGGVHNSGYANGYQNRCYLNDPVDANYACKAGRPVYFDITLSFETGTWSGFGWSINYIGGSDGQIFSRGFCHGQIDAAKITHIGIKCDTQGTGAFRNLYGTLDIIVE